MTDSGNVAVIYGYALVALAAVVLTPEPPPRPPIPPAPPVVPYVDPFDHGPHDMPDAWVVTPYGTQERACRICWFVEMKDAR